MPKTSYEPPTQNSSPYLRHAGRSVQVWPLLQQELRLAGRGGLRGRRSEVMDGGAGLWKRETERKKEVARIKTFRKQGDERTSAVMKV